jgi:hypothetical protein
MGQMPIMGKNKVKYLKYLAFPWTNIAIAAVDMIDGVQFQFEQGVHLY